MSRTMNKPVDTKAKEREAYARRIAARDANRLLRAKLREWYAVLGVA